MNDKEWQAGRQFLEYVLEASVEHRVPMHYIYGIMSRESRCGLALDEHGTGDYAKRNGQLPPDGLGFGRGVMQIDYEAHAFARGREWRDTRLNILYGAKVLRDSITFMRRHHVADEDRAGIAGYNRGPGNILNDLKRGLDVDRYTAGGDYSKDVLRRARWFLERLEREAFGQALTKADPAPPIPLPGPYPNRAAAYADSTRVAINPVTGDSKT